ncbi:MAG: lipid hydroperoxide peroxidase [Omnitrophica bacterium GWA2_52_8]|nr:MAG: lipid hydroperoxide peroxidase [Omnitrophica bacterium GWA2_52_8]
MENQERKGVVTFKGNPLTLVGPALKAGDKAPDFKLLGGDLSVASLDTFKGKTLLISVVPSLDTPVCSDQSKRFNEEAAKLPASVVVLTVSADLPFAQGRWCGAAGAKNLKTLSDHREVAFGKSYGVLIKELRLLSRSIFIVSPDRKIQYLEIVKEVTQHPDYDKALDALKAGVKG